MSENFSILKVLPPKLRAARIGSCYNTYKRELIQGSQAFDLKKLAAANLLESVLGSSKTYFNLSSSSKKSMSNKFRSMAAQAQFGLGACKASLGFNMSSAGTSASTQRDIGGYLSHMVNGTFYQMNITDMFGHGVVTKLDLTSGAYAKFTLTASSTANSETAKYGVSGSYGTPSGAGAAAATEWGKSHKEAIGEMNLAYESEVFPPNSPAGKWVEPLREMAIEWAKDLAKPPKFAEVKDPDAPKLPDIPKVPKPEPVEPPKPNAAQKDEEDEEKLKLELKRQDGCEELSMSEWEEEIETLEEKDLDGHLSFFRI